MITSNRYLCPDHVNPAEFLADLISIDYSSSESVYSSQKRIDALVESFSQRTSAVIYTTPLLKDGGFRRSMTFSKKPLVKRKGNWWRQFWLLLRRAWMQVTNFCYFLWPFRYVNQWAICLYRDRMKNEKDFFLKKLFAVRFMSCNNMLFSSQFQ